jgi:hypothetical protein
MPTISRAKRSGCMRVFGGVSLVILS